MEDRNNAYFSFEEIINMAEECGQYQDSTYRVLKGLRKNNTSHSPDKRDSSLKVPPKRNTAVLPKYPELNIKRGGALHKKLKEYEVLLLEYEEEGDMDDDDGATTVVSSSSAADDGEDDDGTGRSEDENERCNIVDGDRAIVYEENECNHEGERNDAKWRSKKDEEDGNDTLTPNGKNEKERNNQADDIDTQEGEEENDEDNTSIAPNRGGKNRDGTGDDRVVEECEEKKGSRDRGHISAARHSVGRKHNFKGGDKAAHKGGEEKDNGNRCDDSIAAVYGLESYLVHAIDTEADHTNDTSSGDVVVFEDGMKLKMNRVPKSDDGGGNNISFEPETGEVKSQEHILQNGGDFGIDDDDVTAAADDDYDDDDDNDNNDDNDGDEDECDYDGELSKSETQVAEYDDWWNDNLTDDTLSQYSDIQTDIETERDDDIEESYRSIHSSPANGDINGQTQTRGLKRQDTDDHENDDSMPGILGIYANSQ